MSDILLGHIERTIAADSWPAPGEPFVLAVSGGSDSVALAHLLDTLNTRDARGWTLHLAHLDHRLRGPHSAADARFVAAMAQRHGWACTIEQRDVQALSASTGQSLEDAARSARYVFFDEVMDDVGATVLATAHTADDQVETILQRMLRGTGLRGLAGIPTRRPLTRGAARTVLRPLLACSKDALRAHLESAAIAYREDDSNASLEPQRNRIRQRLLPLLEADYNPQVREALLRIGQQCTWWNSYLDDILERQFGETALEVGRRHVTLSAKALCRLPVIIRMEVIRRATVVVGARQRQLSFQHFVTIAEFATRKVSGKRLELPEGLRVARQRDALRFEITGTEE